jgi:hypothetical protein
MIRNESKFTSSSCGNSVATGRFGGIYNSSSKGSGINASGVIGGNSDHGSITFS